MDPPSFAGVNSASVFESLNNTEWWASLLIGLNIHRMDLLIASRSISSLYDGDVEEVWVVFSITISSCWEVDGILELLEFSDMIRTCRSLIFRITFPISRHSKQDVCPGLFSRPHKHSFSSRSVICLIHMLVMAPTASSNLAACSHLHLRILERRNRGRSNYIWQINMITTTDSKIIKINNLEYCRKNDRV